MCMNVISAHGGLVYTCSVICEISEGVTVLIRNSTVLLTLCIVLYNGVINDNGDKLQPEILETKLIQKQIFTKGNCLWWVAM